MRGGLIEGYLADDRASRPRGHPIVLLAIAPHHVSYRPYFGTGGGIRIRVTDVVGKHLADVGCAGSVCHQILEVLYCQTNSPGLPGHGDDEVASYLVGILGLLYHVGIYGVGGHL